MSKTTEWETEFLGETDTGNAIWRAQRLTADNGKVYLGVRKFAKRKNGELVVTSSGVSIGIDSPAQAIVELAAVREQLDKLYALVATPPAANKPRLELLTQGLLEKPRKGGYLFDNGVFTSAEYPGLRLTYKFTPATKGTKARIVSNGKGKDITTYQEAVRFMMRRAEEA